MNAFIAYNSTHCIFLFALWLEKMLPEGHEPGIGAIIGQTTSLVEKDASEGRSVQDAFSDRLVEVEVTDSDSAGTGVSVMVVPTV